MSSIALNVDPCGTLRCIYTDAIDLRAFGTLHIERASHVEWDEQAQGWTVTFANGERLPEIFPTRQAAIEREIEALNARLDRGESPIPKDRPADASRNTLSF